MQEDQIVVDFAEDNERSQVSSMVSAQNSVTAIREKLLQKGFITCEECGDEIPADRRAAYPSARTCVPCQVWLEKHYAS